MSKLLANDPLIAALIGVVVAQVIKIPIDFATSRKWNWSLMFSTGGMPSSHSAAVSALATAVAIEHGLDSTSFAISTVFAIIVMYDAAGIRRHAGQHAALLNQLMEDLQHIISDVKELRVRPKEEKREKLKELLGHKPAEVLIGSLLGIIIALSIYT
ncbi:MAG: divergent PAP2 family protein [Bacillaceae bacterium]|nr:divergent PAP2 family protein [Bacillaceae bacterium]